MFRCDVCGKSHYEVSGDGIARVNSNFYKCPKVVETLENFLVYSKGNKLTRPATPLEEAQHGSEC